MTASEVQAVGQAFIAAFKAEVEALDVGGRELPPPRARGVSTTWPVQISGDDRWHVYAGNMPGQLTPLLERYAQLRANLRVLRRYARLRRRASVRALERARPLLDFAAAISAQAALAAGEGSLPSLLDGPSTPEGE